MHDPHHQLHVFSDLESLSRAGAEFWVEQANLAIAQQGKFHVALTGGNTPLRLYELLASESYSSQVDWSHVCIYLGDERVVPADHPQSNFRMAKQALLDHVPLLPEQIHPVPTELESATAGALAYEALLNNSLPAGENKLPEFDLIMLGMGDDGHTASLFPGTDILDETGKQVAAVYVDKLSAWRISLTFPVINQARQIMLMACGENKAPILAEVFTSKAELKYPIQRVKPVGQMHWFMDETAASQIEQLRMTT